MSKCCIVCGGNLSRTILQSSRLALLKTLWCGRISRLFGESAAYHSVRLGAVVDPCPQLLPGTSCALFPGLADPECTNVGMCLAPP